jgi:hypothetical protein
MLGPFLIVGFVICPTLPAGKTVVVETVATFTGKVTHIGYIKLNF